MREIPTDATLPEVLYQIAFKLKIYSMEAIFEFAFRFPEAERERVWRAIERAQRAAQATLEESV